RSKLISTMTSVPPCRGSAPGRSAFAASASAHVAGLRKSMSQVPRFSVRADARFGRSLPGGRRGRGVVGEDGALDEPVRAVRGEVDLVVVVQAERLEVDEEVVLVGQR